MRLLALPVALLASGVLSQKSSDVKCADGLYLVVARGTSEKEGPGTMGVLAEDVLERIRGSVIEPLDYPAALINPDYQSSETQGVEAMQDVVTSYYEACPNGKIAIFGFSQGGQVASDAFCGGSGDGFSEADPLPVDLVKDSVVAIVIFGDPSHVADASYNKGTSKNDGLFARENVTLCEDNYGDIFQSYCDTGDTYCDRGDERSVHAMYVSKYGDDVVDFVVEQYEKAESGGEDESKTESAKTSKATAASTTVEPRESATGESTASGTAASSATETADNAASGVMPGLGLVGFFSMTLVLGIVF